jgi:hypothetical protein
VTKHATIKDLNIKVNKLAEFVSNQTSTIRGQIGSILGISHDGKRDLYDVYGYPKSLSGDTGFALMYKYSMRQGVASRVTRGVAKSCWRDGFEIYDGSGDDANLILEDEVLSLVKASAVKKLESVDILNRIGRFSVLYVGIPDGKQPEEPLQATNLGPDWLDKIYFVAYPYDGINISGQVQDPTDPRFGLPEYYQLQRGQSQSANSKDTSLNAITAHWSRCIHLNEGALESDIEGMGALEPIFNAILDIEKATGGSSEAYFRNSRQKLAYEIDKEFANAALKDEESKKKFQEAAERFTNEWQDHTMAAGATVKPVQVSHASPLDTVKVALWTVTSDTGIPVRKLTGEGSGQLAGSEDQLAYNQIIRDRQRVECSLWVCRLLEILYTAGMIDLPENYEVRFPQQEAATEKEQAEINNKNADTLQKVTSAVSSVGGDAIDLQSALEVVGMGEIEIDENTDILDAQIDAIEEPDANPNDRA